jgi:3-dehydroshikimate dehydratase
MIQSGLVSVTFRQLPPSQIIELVRQSGLQAIEWGGDIHVPHGEVKRAREVRQMTEQVGLKVSSYGSYYQAGCEENSAPFEEILATARELNAPTVRVWAGNQGSELADTDWREQVLEDSKRISALAAAEGINIAYEYHEATLTDTPESACWLLNKVNLDNVRSYWQPPMGLDQAERLRSLQVILPWLSNLHIFNQTGDAPEPLIEGISEWARYMDIVNNLPGERFGLIEFVKGDSPDQFLEDAEALKKIFSMKREELA